MTWTITGIAHYSLIYVGNGTRQLSDRYWCEPGGSWQRMTAEQPRSSRAGRVRGGILPIADVHPWRPRDCMEVATVRAPAVSKIHCTGRIES